MLCFKILIFQLQFTYYVILLSCGYAFSRSLFIFLAFYSKLIFFISHLFCFYWVHLMYHFGYVSWFGAKSHVFFDFHFYIGHDFSFDLLSNPELLRWGFSLSLRLFRSLCGTSFLHSLGDSFLLSSFLDFLFSESCAFLLGLGPHFVAAHLQSLSKTQGMGSGVSESQHIWECLFSVPIIGW